MPSTLEAELIEFELEELLPETSGGADMVLSCKGCSRCNAGGCNGCKGCGPP